MHCLKVIQLPGWSENISPWSNQLATKEMSPEIDSLCSCIQTETKSSVFLAMENFPVVSVILQQRLFKRMSKGLSNTLFWGRNEQLPLKVVFICLSMWRSYLTCIQVLRVSTIHCYRIHSILIFCASSFFIWPAERLRYYDAGPDGVVQVHGWCDGGTWMFSCRYADGMMQVLVMIKPVTSFQFFVDPFFNAISSSIMRMAVKMKMDLKRRWPKKWRIPKRLWARKYL